MTPENIAALLERTRFNVAGEKALQADVATRLEAAGVEFRREVRLSGYDIIDFMAGAVGIEVKVKGSARAILRQLKRYAAHDEVSSIILLSAVSMGLPSDIGGKPMRVVSLGRAWL